MKTTVTTDEIVDAIRGGEHKFEGIRRRLGVRAIDFRVVDRALQKARKDGLVKYECDGGWKVVERKGGAEAVTAPTPALPVAVWEGEVMGIRVAVLEDGRRIINADDLTELFERIGSENIDPVEFARRLAALPGGAPTQSNSEGEGSR